MKWTRRGLRQWIEAQTYVARVNPAAAARMAERIAAAARLLTTQPKMGRLGRVRGTREWVVGNTPYLLVYRIRSETVEILRVIHGKRHWPPGRLP